MATALPANIQEDNKENNVSPKVVTNATRVTKEVDLKGNSFLGNPVVEESLITSSSITSNSVWKDKTPEKVTVASKAEVNKTPETKSKRQIQTVEQPKTSDVKIAPASSNAENKSTTTSSSSEAPKTSAETTVPATFETKKTAAESLASTATETSKPSVESSASVPEAIKAPVDSPKRTAIVFVLLYYFVFMFCAYRKWSMSAKLDEPVLKQPTMIPITSQLEELKLTPDAPKTQFHTVAVEEASYVQTKIFPEKIVIMDAHLEATKIKTAPEKLQSTDLTVSVSASMQVTKPAPYLVSQAVTGVRRAVNSIQQKIVKTFAQVASFFLKIFGIGK